MKLANLIKKKPATAGESSCGCGHHASRTEAPTNITKEMIVRDVTQRWPQTVNVFGKHKVDFCCCGAHSIEQTANARGCKNVEALVTDLNAAISAPSK